MLRFDEIGAKRERLSILALMFSLLRQSFQKLLQNDPLRMAGATAFFTSFALPFILIILSRLMRLVYDVAEVRNQLNKTLAGVFGETAVTQVVENLRAFRQFALNGWVTIIGVLFLFLVSTTLLMVIKASMNQLWNIKVVAGRSFVQGFRVRLQSVLIIVITAMLVSLSIVAEGVKAYLDQSIHHVLPALASFFTGALNYFFSVLFVTLWFGIIFRLLPDARAPWRIAFTGAFLTSLLFNLGKYLLRILLVNSNLNTLYGASASIVLVLLFVFYSSLILYFGVAFTKVWARHVGASIKPLPYSTRFKLQEIDEIN